MIMIIHAVVRVVSMFILPLLIETIVFSRKNPIGLNNDPMNQSCYKY